MESNGLEPNEKESAGVEQLHDENEKANPAEAPATDQLGTRELLASESSAYLDDLGTYVDMFAQYRHDQRAWLGPAQQPLVFHIAKLCRKLDADPDAPASLSSAYLQAIQRLDRQRPGSREPAGAAGDLPGQRSIFDELD